ncbi:hypothetical protein ACETU7_19875 [Rhodococcus sp. 3Y1]
MLSVPEIVASENYSQIADLTVLMLRGLALSRAVQKSDASARRSISQWAGVVRLLLTQN